MAKSKKHSQDKRAKHVDKGTERSATSAARSWKETSAARQFWYIFGLLVALTWFIFYLNVFKDHDFRFGGDNLAAAPIDEMGTDYAREDKVPEWCPYILGGMPTLGSLLYAANYYPGLWLHIYPKNPVCFALNLVFLNSRYAWLFWHFVIAGLGIFYLAKSLRLDWTIAAACSLFFAFNPSMAVFADVGHGSKLMTIAYLPWILLLTRRLFEKPNIGRGAWLAFVFGLQLLALHVQIAFYGAMMMGLYAVYAFIAGGKESLKSNIRAAALLIGAGVFAFFLAAPLYLQVQEYTHFSIRGGGATGGASWDYATAWSFHPLESLTYIFPSFYGFGGGTYWGHMPFTDMPLYWGGAILLFAPWALILKRNRMTIFLAILAALAWIVSFGKFLPILYWPLFEFLPYFNKFRVPSLIQVLVLLPVVILAGVALQAFWEKAREKSDVREKLSRQILWAGCIVTGLCFLLLILQAALRPTFTAWMISARPQMQGGAAEQAFSLFTGDLLRLLLLTGILYGSSLLILKGKWPRGLLVGAVALCAVLELSYFDRQLISPTPPQQMQAYLQTDDVTQYLQKQTEPFRILPLTQGRNPDWYMAHRIESVLGYTGAKPRLYQEAIDSIGYNNFGLLRMLNTRFIVHDKPINNAAFEEVFVGRDERVSRFKEALPRAFLVNRSVAATPAEILQFYRRGDFDFGSAVALEKAPTAPLDGSATGTVNWVSRSPDVLTLDVNSSGRQMLVLSEPYYPSGWTATLDGQPTDIRKANYLFRALEIPAGNHRVEMHFKSLQAATGNLLKWIAIVGIAAGLLSSFIPHRKGAAGGV